VELGPSKTLINMGQKTIKRKIASAERPVDSRVQFLASTQDTKELCYEYDMPVSLEEEILEDKQPSLKASSPSLERIRNTPPPSAASVATVIIEDIPLSGEDIVRALVARKLKKPIAQISTSKSVKELCGGMFLLSSNSLKVSVGL
jgi:fatty acid synthase subunit alpha, fungi type